MLQYRIAAALLLATAAFGPAFAAEPQDDEQAEELLPATEDEAGDSDEPLNLSAFMASLLGEEPMSEEDLQSAIEAASAYPLGSERNPVRADGPPGERAYLSRLRCRDLRPPTFERLGSGGASPFGGIVDIYKVECRAGDPPETRVYMDMYHAGHFEEEAVPGFGITGGRAAR